MSWIILTIIGAIIGAIASAIVATGRPSGLLFDIVLGIAGSLLGKWLFADVLGIGGASLAGTLTLAGIFWGVLGAIVLILILRAIRIY